MDDATRASDREREAAVARLTSAAGEGRLTFEELADRTELAERAVTRGELEAVVADLPAGPASWPATVATPPRARERSILGDLRRSGGWAVPARGRWSTWLGDVMLDLREARLPDGEIHLTVTTVLGDVQLLVPEGMDVELRTRTFLGDVKREDTAGRGGGPRVVIHVRTVFGDVRVRHRTRREARRARRLERG